ncbi:MAG: LysM peptidoglycan-binding domain-containing protein [Candidatus Promineifilaceae bacterium]
MRRTINLLALCLVAGFLAACGRLDVSLVTPTPRPSTEVAGADATTGSDQESLPAPRVTRAPSSSTSPPGETPEDTAEVTEQPTRDQTGESAGDSEPGSDESGPVVAVCTVRTDWPSYAVTRGDTLSRIARDAGATVDQLVQANCLDDPDRLYSGQRLRVPRIPPDPDEPMATPRPAPWARYEDDLYQVSFDYPAAWRDVSEGLMTRLAGEDGWVQLSAAGAPADLDTVAGNEAHHKLQPYGASPVVEPLTLSDGRPARLILPSADQPAAMNGQAMIITPFAQPVLIGSYAHNYLMLAADGDHIRQISASLTLPPPEDNIGIDSFNVSGEDLPTGGKRLTFRWQAVGATRGVITSGTAQRFAPWWPVDSAGELVVDVSGTLYPDPVMTLRMINDVTGQEALATAVLPWECDHSYFFQPGPEACPREAALVVDGAFQPFQRGFMIWLPRPDLTQPSIYVFSDDGRVSLYPDTWTADDPDNDLDETPPEGLFEPVGGFAKVWREHPSVRADLGWGTDAEWLYTATYQAESRESLPGVAYLTRPDGSMVRLLDTIWQVYVPGQDLPGVGGGPTP